MKGVKKWCATCKSFVEPLPGRAPESHPMGYGAYVEHCRACLAELTGVREAGPSVQQKTPRRV